MKEGGGCLMAPFYFLEEVAKVIVKVINESKGVKPKTLYKGNISDKDWEKFQNSREN